VPYLIRHIIIELHRCTHDTINDALAMETLLRDIAGLIQTEIVSGVSHRFDPQGVTAMLIIGASHLSLHSWPEYGYASCDLVVCTENFYLPQIIELVKTRVGAETVNFIEFRRGLIDHDGSHHSTH